MHNSALADARATDLAFTCSVARPAGEAEDFDAASLTVVVVQLLWGIGSVIAVCSMRISKPSKLSSESREKECPTLNPRRN